jgi:uncharacterized protein (DUF2336 family)
MIVARFLTWMETADAEQRADAAFALARLWVEPELDAEDREAAEAGMTLLIDDCERSVRFAVAKAVSPLPSAPRHILLSLAGDETQIAVEVLARSQGFLDGELIGFAQAGTAAQQAAIACRKFVSAAVCEALAVAGGEDACFAILMNDGAEPSATALHTIAERHGTNTALRRLLLRRTNLMPATRLILIDKLGASLREEIAGTPGLAPARVEELLADHAERAIISYAAKAGDEEITAIAVALIEAGRLTTAFLLRAICSGNIALFSGALSVLTQTPLRRVDTVLDSGKRPALRALYVKAGLPDSAFEVFAAAIEIWRSVLLKGEGDSARITYVVTRELLSTYRGNGNAEVDNLLVLLRRLAAEAARRNARNEAGRITRKVREEEQRMIEEQARDPHEALLEAYPVIEVPQMVLADFALHFAEEIVDLEDRLAEGGLEPATTSETAIAVHAAAANDDVPEKAGPMTVDFSTAEARAA